MIASAEKLILTMETVYDVLTAVEKIGKVTDLPLDGEEGLDFANIDQENGMAIELNNICFRFADAEKPALDELSLSIGAGQRVCVASYKGSGKSTLIRIIAGFYTGYTGSLAYNGFSIKSLSLSSLRQYIGYHSQQEDIFKGTILENILLDKEGIDLNKVMEVAKNVNLHQHIQRLPQGYSTQLSPGGRNLSHSLRTKIMLVRSIVAKPRLMAMEDFLHKLDQSDRKTLTDYLLNSGHPWTLVAVSNDPDFAAQCDKVIILKEGRVVEEGTFTEIKQSAHFEQVFNISSQV
jgi:ABC-type bacteriocin/lantibiotic exporter with double-glycine peptidase domain